MTGDPSGGLRLVVTTRGGLRHRLFLGLVESRLGTPAGVLVQEQPRRPGENRAPARRSLARARLGAGLAPHLTVDPVRRLGRLRLGERESTEEHLARLLAHVEPVDLDELGRRASVRMDADPNSQETAAWLEGLRPDLILVFGGRILREPWLSLAPLGAINMHYGVLPHYGGAASTEYALYHDRPDRLGATIHYLDAGIDSGPIIERRPVELEPGEPLERCRARVYSEGLDALVACAARADAVGHVGSERQRGSVVYRRGANALAVEAAAQLRLDTAASFPSLERAIEAAPRARGLRGRLAPSRLPGGVYVLLYHSIVDDAAAETWELAFDVAATPLALFRSHMEYVARHFAPIALDEAPEILREGPADRPYAAITFDDGYRNLLSAAPVCSELGLGPTVFACASFAAGRAVNYRVLLAALIRLGHARAAAGIIAEALADDGFDAESLWVRSKDAYRHGATEAAVEQAWRELVGGLPSVHLSFEELRRLAEAGWSIGNHTLDHVPLVGLDRAEIARQVDENERALAAAGLATIPWLSYPLGMSRKVDAELGAFMDSRPELMGAFAGGGVNLIESRRDWLRIGIFRQSPRALRDDLFREARATLLALERLARS